MTEEQAQARAVPPELVEMLAGRPQLAEKFQHFQNAFHEEGALDPRLLELCRARSDALHGVEQVIDEGAGSEAVLDVESGRQIAGGQFDAFAEHEQQALSLAEQLAIDAHGVSDQQVAALTTALGEAAAVSLLTAVSMHDARIRLQKVLEPFNKRSVESQ